MTDRLLLDNSDFLNKLDQVGARWTQTVDRIDTRPIQPRVDTSVADRQITALEQRMAQLTSKVSTSLQVGQVSPTPSANLGNTGAGQSSQALQQLTEVIKELTTAYREMNGDAAKNRAALNQVDPAYQALARTIKQLSTEWRAGKGDATEFSAQMTTLRARANELAEGELLGSRNALLLASAISTASRALGENARAASPAAAEAERLRRGVAGTRAEYQSHNATAAQTVTRLRELYDQAQRLSGQLPRESAEWLKLQTTMRTAAATMDVLKGKTPLLGIQDALERAIAKNGPAFQALITQLASFGGPVGNVLTQMGSFTSGLQGMTAAEIAAVAPVGALAAAFLALGAAITASIHAAIPFEAGLKQLQALTGLSNADIGELGRGFQQLSGQLPITSNELVEVARNAALVGVHGKEEIAQYTEVMAQLGVLLRDTNGNMHDLEGTGRELAKFLNAAGIAGDAFIPALRVMSSELITLKTHVGGTVPEILNMSSYLVSMGTKLGLTAEQVLALSSAIASTGGKAQASGHAIARIIEDMQDAALNGGKVAQDYARILGLTAEQFQQLALHNPAEAFKLLAGGIDNATKGGRSIAEIFDTLNIKNVRLKQTIAEAAVAFPKLATALGIAQEAQSNQGDLAARAAIATDNFRDKTKKLEDVITSIAQAIGIQFLPALSGVIDKTAAFATTLLNVAQGAEPLPDKLKLVADGILGIGVAIGTTSVITKISTLVTSLGALRLATSELALIDGAQGAGLFARIGGLLGGGAGGGIKALTGLLTAGVSSAAAFGIIAGAVVALAAYSAQLYQDTLNTYQNADKASDASDAQLNSRIQELLKAGDTRSRTQAAYLNALQRYSAAQQGTYTGTTLFGERQYKVNPAQVEAARQQMQALRAQLTELDKAAPHAAASVSHVADHSTGEQFGEMAVKIGELNAGLTKTDSTPLQQALDAAREKVQSYRSEVQKLLDAGKLKPDEGKALLDKADRTLTDATESAVNAQIKEAGKTRTELQKKAEDDRLAVIKDARLKRQSELRNELTDLSSSYQPKIDTLRTESKTKGITPAQRADLLGQATELEQELGRAQASARRRANSELDDIDRERLKRVHDGQVAALADLAAQSAAQVSLVQGQKEGALAAAGQNPQARLAVEARYGRMLADLQASARHDKLRADQLALQNQLTAALEAAKGAGAQRATLEGQARAAYLQQSKTLETTYETDVNGIRLKQRQDYQTAYAALVKVGVDKELAGIKDVTAAELSALQVRLQGRLAAANAQGDRATAQVYADAIKQVEGVKLDNIRAFRTELTQSEKTAVSLRGKLNDVASTPLDKALSSAAAPYNEVIKGAGDQLDALAQKLKKADLTPADRARYERDQRELAAVALDANKQRNAALTAAQQKFATDQQDRAQVDAQKLAKTEYDASKGRDADAYLARLDQYDAYWAARIELARKRGDEAAVAEGQQHIADNQGERVRVQGDQRSSAEDARALARDEAQSQLDLATTEAARVQARATLIAQDQQRLGQIQGELNLAVAQGASEADINKLKRERLSVQGELKKYSDEDLQRANALLDAHREELQLNADVATTERERLDNRARLLAATQGDLARANTDLNAARESGAPQDRIDALTERRATLMRSIVQLGDQDRQRINAGLDGQRAELQLAQDLATNDVERTAARRQLLSFDQNRLAGVEAELTSARETGATQERLLELEGQRATLKRNILQLQDEERQRAQELVDSQLKLQGAQNSYAQATARSNADVLSSKQEALALSGRELANIDRQIAGSREARLTDAQVNDLQAQRYATRQSIFEQERGIAQFTTQLNRDQLDLLEAQARAQLQVSGLAGDAVTSKRVDLDLTRQRLAETEAEIRASGTHLLTDKELADLQKERLNLIGQEAQQQRELVQAALARQRAEADFAEASTRSSLARTRFADDAVAVARVDLAATRQKLDLNQRELSSASALGLSQDDLLAKQQERVQLLGTEAEQVRKLEEAERARLELQRSLRDSLQALNVAARDQGGASAIARANSDLATSFQRLQEAEGDAAPFLARLQASQTARARPADLLDFREADKGKSRIDALTSSLGDYRSKLDAVAQAYDHQVSGIESVVDATAKLNDVVNSGTPDGRAFAAEVNETKRQQALAETGRLLSDQRTTYDQLSAATNRLAQAESDRITLQRTELGRLADQVKKGNPDAERQLERQLAGLHIFGQDATDLLARVRKDGGSALADVQLRVSEEARQRLQDLRKQALDGLSDVDGLRVQAFRAHLESAHTFEEYATLSSAVKLADAGFTELEASQLAATQRQENLKDLLAKTSFLAPESTKRDSAAAQVKAENDTMVRQVQLRLGIKDAILVTRDQVDEQRRLNSAVGDEYERQQAALERGTLSWNAQVQRSDETRQNVEAQNRLLAEQAAARLGLSGTGAVTQKDLDDQRTLNQEALKYSALLKQRHDALYTTDKDSGKLSLNSDALEAQIAVALDQAAQKARTLNLYTRSASGDVTLNQNDPSIKLAIAGAQAALDVQYGPTNMKRAIDFEIAKAKAVQEALRGQTDDARAEAEKTALASGTAFGAGAGLYPSRMASLGEAFGDAAGNAILARLADLGKQAVSSALQRGARTGAEFAVRPVGTQATPQNIGNTTITNTVEVNLTTQPGQTVDVDALATKVGSILDERCQIYGDR